MTLRIAVKDVALQGRVTTGVKVCNLNPDDVVSDVTIL